MTIPSSPNVRNSNPRVTRFLKVPDTAAGTDHLLTCLFLARGFDFPDGSDAADFDWDKEVIKAERENAQCDKWLAEREQTRNRLRQSLRVIQGGLNGK